MTISKVFHFRSWGEQMFAQCSIENIIKLYRSQCSSYLEFYPKNSNKRFPVCLQHVIVNTDTLSSIL